MKIISKRMISKEVKALLVRSNSGKRLFVANPTSGTFFLVGYNDTSETFESIKEGYDILEKYFEGDAVEITF